LSKAKSPKWSRKPVGIRSAYIAAGSVVAAAIITGLFALAADVLTSSTNHGTGALPSAGIDSQPTPLTRPSATNTPANVPVNPASPPRRKLDCNNTSAPTGGLLRYRPSSAPFSAAIYRFLGDVNGVAFPYVLKLSKSTEQDLSGPDFQSWVLSHRGYDVADTLFDLTITTHRDLQILQMRAFLISCSSPATGTLLTSPVTSPVIPATGVEFELGSTDPVALGLRQGTPYFYGRTFEVMPGDPSTFQVNAFAIGASFEWEIELTILWGSSSESFLIGDYNKPFLTTAGPSASERYEQTLQQCGIFAIPVCRGVPDGYWVPVK